MVAEDAAGEQDRRHLRTSRRRDRPDLEDAAVQPHEPPVRDAMRDRARPEPRRRELRRRHDPMLAARERRDRLVTSVHFVDLTHLWRVRSTLCSSGVHFVDLTRAITVTSTKCTLRHAY